MSLPREFFGHGTAVQYSYRTAVELERSEPTFYEYALTPYHDMIPYNCDYPYHGTVYLLQKACDEAQYLRIAV